MTLFRTMLCGLLLLSAVPTAQAADASTKFALKGAGFLPCQLFVAEREKRSNVYYLIGGWVEGYVSAYNQLTADTYDITSFESLELLLGVIDNHCRANATDPLFRVVASIVNQISDDRIVAESPMVEIAEGEAKTRLYRETIGRIQTALTELGLYKDAIDGRWTDATRAALIAFQSDIGFETTGFPDQATLWRLLRK